MMGTGFRARYSLETILSADYADLRRLEDMGNSERRKNI